MKKKTKKQNNQADTMNNEEKRLELLNLAVLFRSEMIEKEEFHSKARLMGYTEAPETLLRQIPVMDLG